jgi:hypothetical protein
MSNVEAELAQRIEKRADGENSQLILKRWGKKAP